MTMSAEQAPRVPDAPTPGQSGDWFGHPRGLTILAATEMWEVFSFVGMRTLLVYYMIGDLGFSQAKASLVYGSYTGFAYFAPIIGAIICDLWLGKRRSVLFGGLLMSLGHFLLVFPDLFAPALVAVGLGAGLYLPALPSQIAQLYHARDPRRSWAYNSYYMGMNGGALLAPLVCGTLGEMLGWHWGFGAAGIGMLIGVAVYAAGSRYLPADDIRPRAMTSRDAAERGARHSTGAWRQLGLIAIVALFVIIYRSANEQTGNTLAIWLESGVDRSILGYEVPMTWFQSINPIAVILLTPLLLWRWDRLSRAGRLTSDLMKMAFGALLLGGGFAMLAALTASGAPQIGAGWVFLFLLILTVGELYMMPIALGVFNRLAPAGWSSLGAAVWFATASGGHLLAGALGATWSMQTPASFFVVMTGIAMLAALLLASINRAVLAADAARGPGANAELDQNR